MSKKNRPGKSGETFQIQLKEGWFNRNILISREGEPFQATFPKGSYLNGWLEEDTTFWVQQQPDGSKCIISEGQAQYWFKRNQLPKFIPMDKEDTELLVERATRFIRR